MEYFMGDSFNKEQCKPYKKLDAAERAAAKQKAAVFNEDGEIIKDFRGVIETPSERAQEGTQKQTEMSDTDQEQPVATMTDKVPEGALDTDKAGNVPTYNEEGQKIGTETPEQIAAAEETVTDNIDGVPAVRIRGKIRRVFNGSIRIRKNPSWGNDSVRGATAFNEKVVTHVMEVDGKPMYKTLDGYFISGDPKLVEYIEK